MTQTLQGPPVVTETGPDAFGFYRLHVDGQEVVTVGSVMTGRLWKCSPEHRHGRMGGCSWVPLGEHVDGCGWVMSSAEWNVRPTRVLGTGHYIKSLPAAMEKARELAQNYTSCSLPVRARLCRLVKRHDGPCLPWD